MKTWVHSSSPSGQTLRLSEIPVPSPKADELLVRVKAASFNRGEFVAAKKNPQLSEGKPAGIECTGEIVQVGSLSTGFDLDEKVMGRARMAFSEFAIFQKGDAMRVPNRLSWEEAASASITYQVVADVLFEEAHLEKEWLLITGVTSGVGVAALQLGKLKGAKVIGTTRDHGKLAKLAELGLDYGLVYEDHGFVRHIMEITDNYGVDVIVNNVGGGLFANCQKILAYQGRMATVGNLDGIGHAVIDLTTHHKKRLKLFGSSNKMRPPHERAKSVSLFVRDILPAMSAGKIVPLVDHVFEFNECHKGLDYMKSNSQVGKVVIRL